MSTLGLERLPNRCLNGFDLGVQHRFCTCGAKPASEFAKFVSILQSVATNGVVHQRDARPVLRGAIPPKRIASCYSQAIREGVITEIDRERSNDTVGRNTNKDEPVYRLEAA